MKIKIQFKTMYEPGENSPPQFEDELGPIDIEVVAIPQYRDHIFYKNHQYMIYDVFHTIDDSNTAEVLLTATRRVTYPPSRDEGK